jgi:predicted kinase
MLVFSQSNYIFTHKFAILSYMKSLSLASPHMIIMVGIPGSGKSFFAKQFSDTFHAPLVSDAVLGEFVSNASDSANLAFRQIDELVKTNQSILVDGFASSRTQRNDLTKLAHKAGYEPLYIWVQTDLGTAKARVARDKSRSDNQRSSEGYASLLKHFTEPSSAERTIVISGKHTYATQARIVLKKLSAPRAEAAAADTPPPRTDIASPHHGVRNIVIR